LSRFLALDWDAQQLLLVSGDVGRKGVRVEKAVSWPLPEELRPASAEMLGRKLRDFLKSQDISPAPLLACLGRERVIIKELRFPAVAAAEEPGLVRFQASKDLTDAPDDVILDYTHLRHPEADGERQAMAVIARRALITSLQGLCRGLGVKLVAVTPRAYGLAGALDRARQLGTTPESSPLEQAAVLSVGERWAELCVVRGRQVLFSRSPAVGPTLAGEIKRSLALHAAQYEGTGERPGAVFVAGGSEQALFRDRLQEVLALPVFALNITATNEAADDQRLQAAAVGLLHLWGVAGSFPINFLAPKQAKPVTDASKRRKVFLGIGAGLIALALIVVAYLQLADKQREVARLTTEKLEAQANVKKLAQDRLDVDYLKEWDQATIAWLDELHDLTAQFPQEVGFHLNGLIAAVNDRKIMAKDKEKYVAKLTLEGEAPKDQTRLVAKLADTLNRDSHLRATVKNYAGQKFTLEVEVAPHAHQGFRHVAAAPRRAPTRNGEGGQQ
jgi:hypothetical protein